MRKTLSALTVVVMIAGVSLPAAAGDVEGPASIVERVLERVESWLSKAEVVLDPNGNKAGSDWDPDSFGVGCPAGGLASVTCPALDGAGPEWDPNG